jgi:hypothetical protein
VEVEAVELGLTRAAGDDVTEVWLVTEASDAGAGAGAEGDAALDGGAGEAGQDGRGFRERVRRGCVVGGLQAAGEQASDTGANGGEDVRHVVVTRWGRGVKGKRPWPSCAEDAVEHQRVEVDIELEAAAEALYGRDRPGLAAADAV